MKRKREKRKPGNHRKKRKKENLPPLFLHAVPALQPLVLAFAKVGILEDPVPFRDHVLARILPEVPQEPQDLAGVVMLMDHIGARSVIACLYGNLGIGDLVSW
jgi:hypothetical protein